jgi:hypothetical protein
MSKKKELPKIGSKMYAIHRKYIDENLNCRVLVATVRTYERVNGQIRPVLSVVGHPKQEVHHDTHYVYEDLEKCMKALKGGKRGVSK